MNFPQTSGKEKLSSAEKEAETQGRAEYESGKDTLTRARDSTEKLYNEARQKAAAARDDAEKKVDHGWSSWFNWGKSKADDIESEVEKGKHA